MLKLFFLPDMSLGHQPTQESSILTTHSGILHDEPVVKGHAYKGATAEQVMASTIPFGAGGDTGARRRKETSCVAQAAVDCPGNVVDKVAHVQPPAAGDAHATESRQAVAQLLRALCSFQKVQPNQSPHLTPARPKGADDRIRQMA